MQLRVCPVLGLTVKHRNPIHMKTWLKCAPRTLPSLGLVADTTRLAPPHCRAHCSPAPTPDLPSAMSLLSSKLGSAGARFPGSGACSRHSHLGSGNESSQLGHSVSQAFSSQGHSSQGNGDGSGAGFASISSRFPMPARQHSHAAAPGHSPSAASALASVTKVDSTSGLQSV